MVDIGWQIAALHGFAHLFLKPIGALNQLVEGHCAA
jgi:hypothetical protein